MAEQVTCLIDSLNLTYCESTGMGDAVRSFVRTVPPTVKARLITDSAALALAGELLPDEIDELSALLDRVAARLTEEVKANLSTTAP